MVCNFASVNDGASVTGYGTSDAGIMVDNEISTTGITTALGTTSSIKNIQYSQAPHLIS